MFYSHEILTSSQYGVATIWLAATISKGNNARVGTFRRLSRKAVQGVDVPKACEIIINPDAPLALRLQGSLLYGVSRVYAQQCSYVLADASKTQSDMMTFFRVLQTNETDPKAGKAKRHHIMLEDDPAFDVANALPVLELFRGDKDLFGIPSQGSVSKFSQMTPRGASTHQSASNQALLPFGLPSSSHRGGIYPLLSDFGHPDSPLAKRNRESDVMPDFQPFGDDDLDPITGIGLDFDADGNLVGIMEEELALPPLLNAGFNLAREHGVGVNVFGDAEERIFLPAGDEPVFGMGEEPLPDADAFPVRVASNKDGSSDLFASKSTNSSQSTEIIQKVAKNRRGRRRKFQPMLDQTDRISRAEFRNWSENYVENMGVSRKRIKTTTTAQAKKNAIAFLYGNRIANIGIENRGLGVAHPLAKEFAGEALKAGLHGLEPDGLNHDIVDQRGKRRKSGEAFENESTEDERRRNVKQRVDDEAELGRGEEFGDESAPEIGREAPAPLDDRLASSIMPWSQPGSVVRGHGSAQKAAPSPSPLHGRGSVIGSIERHSDPAETPLIVAGLGSQDTLSIDFGGAIGALDFGRGNETQASSAGLDLATQDFLGYATEQASEKGVMRDGDTDGRRWIEFDDLANPGTHGRAVAAQVFLHVLSLATQNAIAVQQLGADNKIPFGKIRIAIVVGGEEAESAKEIA